MANRIANDPAPITLFPACRALDIIGGLLAMVLVGTSSLRPWLMPDRAEQSIVPDELPGAVRPAENPSATYNAKETVVSAYIGEPRFHRSTARITRPDGTNVELKDMRFDGDAYYPPIDGGLRSIWWRGTGTFGFMVDFLHNKAIAQLGKGAHGRKLKDGVIQSVETTGAIKNQLAPSPLKLTDYLDRFEFTHGHNVLLFNGMMRLGSIRPGIRPYFGVGVGFAIPHVEIWFKGEEQGEQRTDEYQYAGPAAQLVAGLELRRGRMSYYIEYKLAWAYLSGALTGDKSWKNFNMPGDLARQLVRWWKGEGPKLGRFSIPLVNHMVVIGVGYAFPGKVLRP